MALATLVSVIWGLAFVAIKYGLDSFSAPQLTVIRFVIGALPAFFVPRPRLSFAWIVAIGLSLFTGQFLLLFFAYSEGLPAGLASVTQQMQAFFTVLLAAIFLRDLPSVQQGAGMTIAFTGLALIALTVGAEFPPVALALALAGALSWAVGNVLVKHRGRHTGVSARRLVQPYTAAAGARAFACCRSDARFGRRAGRRLVAQYRCSAISGCWCNDGCLRDLGSAAAGLSDRRRSALRPHCPLHRRRRLGDSLRRGV